MRVILLEPFYSGSHKQWALGLQKHSSHEIQILSLPGRFWKWRMHGGAVTLAKHLKNIDEEPDLLIASSMVDVTTVLSLCRQKLIGIPVILYMHENQLTYPWSSKDRDVQKRRNYHYAFIQYTSMLACDLICFNSEFHRTSFFEALPGFLRQYPDKRNLDTVSELEKKSMVLALGMDNPFSKEFIEKIPSDKPKILWNHRWEYDKNPDSFYDYLRSLKMRGIKFDLVVLGESSDSFPDVFVKIKSEFKEELLHWGYVEKKPEYSHYLSKCDLLPVTSYQEFFGGSTIEAVQAGVWPLLPDRLSYPDHIPNYLKSKVLYSTIDQLINMTVEYIANPPSVGDRKEMVRFVQKYNWENIIQEYDQVFESIRHKQ